ncbi:MAG: DUF6252 family protein [Chitinophagales bacterium]
MRQTSIMSNTRMAIVATVLLTFFLFSCKKETSCSGQYFKYNAWGNPKTPDSMYALAAYKTIYTFNHLSTYERNYTEINLTSLAEGTYSLSRSGNVFSFIDSTSGGKSYVSTSGSFTISKNTGDRISGSFSVEAVNTLDSTKRLSLTNGDFCSVPIR